jgi:4a-hydroxytetrahydrobiopterin dehydratase
MASLADRHAAADGTAPRLSDEQAHALLAQLPDWQIVDEKLTRDLQVKNFRAALALVNSIGEVAEEQNHHPDLCIHGWNKVEIELYTHTAHGLSENDFIMAAKFDRLLQGVDKG